jgi:hypothetical protein
MRHQTSITDRIVSIQHGPRHKAPCSYLLKAIFTQSVPVYILYHFEALCYEHVILYLHVTLIILVILVYSENDLVGMAMSFIYYVADLVSIDQL